MLTDAQVKALVDQLPWSEWSQKKFGPGFTVLYRDLVIKSGKATAKAIDSAWRQADPFTSRFMTHYVGERITQLEGTSKDLVTQTVRRVLDEADGLTTTELGSLIRETVEDQFGDFAKYRADRIARSETAIAYNHGTVLGVSQAGGDTVDVFDGEDDDVCAAANGQTWTIEHALADPIAHPNCVRAFSPSAKAA